MSVKLFVGSLSWDTTDESLSAFFAKVGTVVSATVIKDKFSGRSRGFGFVEMSSEEEANQAIEQLNEQELDGRVIKVNIAKPKEDRPRGGQGGFNRGGGSSRGGSWRDRDNNRSGGGRGNRGGGRRDY